MISKARWSAGELLALVTDNSDKRQQYERAVCNFKQNGKILNQALRKTYGSFTAV